ncbi:hypothetical protein ACWFN4_04750 [Bacillus mycoides]|uniref:hypothetical protein n=1 Tax=Bacillus mycoides TaxID=1405 RepID=UPI001F421BC7|nr:hypothetical protein [Bacillus mycoides]
MQVQKKYHLKQITTHGLRHTHCSLLFEAGTSIKDVQDPLYKNNNGYLHTRYTKSERRSYPKI